MRSGGYLTVDESEPEPEPEPALPRDFFYAEFYFQKRLEIRIPPYNVHNTRTNRGNTFSSIQFSEQCLATYLFSTPTMEEGTPLTGSCSCGRNHYIIYAPHPRQSLQLLFDERAEPSKPFGQRVFAAQTNRL